MDKLLSLLGLARRAGKIEPGFDAAVSAARGHKAALLLAARDISEKTLKNLRYEGDRASWETGAGLSGPALGTGRPGTGRPPGPVFSPSGPG